jgi:enoyl-CoA hydratase/carnithine racemase
MSQVSRLAIARDDRGVVTCTVDDAPTRNALGTVALLDLDRVFAAVATDPSARVLVLTGAGSVFSSGADRSELGDPALIEASTRLLTQILTRIDESPVPVVCRVNGAAIGAGLAIAAAADIAIAAQDAFFVLPEVRFGLVPGPAAAACVARMGQTAGLDLMLTGRRFGAPEAARLHLVARVVPRGELDAAVGAVLADLLTGDAAALGATRRLVRRLGGPGMGERLRIARAAAGPEPGPEAEADAGAKAGHAEARVGQTETETGESGLAMAALGSPHRIDGVVEHGDHRGRTLGFPTANLNFDRSAALPVDGIYAGRALALDEWWQVDEAATLGAAAISVGTNPTFGRRQRRVEAHILDFDGDLYGRRVGIEFTSRLRGMIKFADATALIAQMKLDVAQARAILLA